MVNELQVQLRLCRTACHDYKYTYKSNYKYMYKCVHEYTHTHKHKCKCKYQYDESMKYENGLCPELKVRSSVLEGAPAHM